MKSTVNIDTSKLLKRMDRYAEVTGKSVSSSLRRGARLLAVNLATSTPPYGRNQAAKKLGEQAVQNDISRVYTPLTPMQGKYPSKQLSFREQVEKFVTKDHRLREALLSSIDGHDLSKLNCILKNVEGFSKLNVSKGVNLSIYQKTRNEYGRVRKGWKSREIVSEVGELQSFIAKKQNLVGLSKAGWASAALKVNADVKDALRGIPAWVKKQLEKAVSQVIDQSAGGLPLITLTSRIPWADKALRASDYKDAMRISREKFYKSLGTEIRHALKKVPA